MLDLAHSAGGDDKSNSPEPNPGADSADVSKARRAHACAGTQSSFLLFDEPPPQSSLSVCTQEISAALDKATAGDTEVVHASPAPPLLCRVPLTTREHSMHTSR